RASHVEAERVRPFETVDRELGGGPRSWADSVLSQFRAVPTRHRASRARFPTHGPASWWWKGPVVVPGRRSVAPRSPRSGSRRERFASFTHGLVGRRRGSEPAALGAAGPGREDEREEQEGHEHVAHGVPDGGVR